MSQHSPAMKVGGRRLSLPTRARANKVDEAAAASPGEPADYPRPSAPGTEGTTEHAPNEEDAPPKRERRKSHSLHENERRLRENPQRRVDENWQRRVVHRGSNTRISQPGGKVAI
ncbi:hypothetical protein F5148DRAFT_465845, partial [Russula earlei]